MFWIYFFLFTTATGLAVFLKHYHSAFRWFGYTLLFLFLTELVSIYFNRINRDTDLPHHFIYHISIPVFLILIYNFFKSFIQESLVRKILSITIAANSLLAIGLTLFFYKPGSFPGIQLNSMGMIMIGVCLYLLMTLEPIPGIPIQKHPLAWICLGYLIFFSASFFLNGINNRLAESVSPYRSILQALANWVPNIILYASINIGLWFSNAIARSK